MVIDCLEFLWTYLCTGNLISQFCKRKCANTGMSKFFKFYSICGIRLVRCKSK